MASQSQPRKLTRSDKDKVIAGVCGGLGGYFSVDPTIIRIVFAIFGLSGGVGILAYLVFWVIIPVEGRDDEIGERAREAGEEMKEAAQSLADDVRTGRPTNRRMLFGLIIIAIGLVALFNTLFPHHWIRWDIVWAGAIILVGVALMIKRK